MRLRHAAALALVGWYLMVPPLQKPNSRLSHWKTLKVFVSEALCEAERKVMIEGADSDETGESSVIVFATKSMKVLWINRTFRTGRFTITTTLWLDAKRHAKN
jgi:hypothetical protein